MTSAMRVSADIATADPNSVNANSAQRMNPMRPSIGAGRFLPMTLAKWRRLVA
jgi:hypothetical protein